MRIIRVQAMKNSRSTIPPGSPCRVCRGMGKTYKRETVPTGAILPVERHCDNCDGTGRVKPNPIKRTPLKRKKKDLASFDIKVIHEIWKPFTCPLTGLREGNYHNIPLDAQHILGKSGGKYVYSSPLNSCPLSRLVHAYGNRDHRYIRAFLLVRARASVDEALRDGRYVPTPEEMERDAEFAELSADFIPDLR